MTPEPLTADEEAWLRGQVVIPSKSAREAQVDKVVLRLFANLDAARARIAEVERERDEVAAKAAAEYAMATDRIEAAERRAASFEEAILDIDAHAVPVGGAIGEMEPPPNYYTLSVGSLHRALGMVGHSAPKCAALPCPRAEAAETALAERDQYTVAMEGAGVPWDSVDEELHYTGKLVAKKIAAAQTALAEARAELNVWRSADREDRGGPANG